MIRTDSGMHRVKARLVVGADGPRSTVRRVAGFRLNQDPLAPRCGGRYERTHSGSVNGLSQAPILRSAETAAPPPLPSADTPD